MPVPVPARPGRVLYATDGRDVLQNSPDGWEVDSPWLWWDGPAGGDGTGGPWGNPLPNDPTSFGMGGRPGATLPAMARCRALIADAIAGVPFQVFRGRDQIDTPTWILDPQNLADDGRKGSTVRNVALSAVEFWSSVFVSAIELGEGIVYSPRVDGSAFGDLGCFVLNPRDVEIERDRYYVNDVASTPPNSS
jgi:hypothetical protein